MTLNIPALIATRNAILHPHHTHRLDMRETLSLCGTTACIAGFAILVHPNSPRDSTVMDDAQYLLGLSPEQRESLFTPSYPGESDTPDFPPDVTWEDVTPQIAADTIDRLIATNRVTWVFPAANA